LGAFKGTFMQVSVVIIRKKFNPQKFQYPHVISKVACHPAGRRLGFKIYWSHPPALDAERDKTAGCFLWSQKGRSLFRREEVGAGIEPHILYIAYK
jgi:hypothetical protein